MIVIVQPTRRRRPRAEVPTGPIGGLTDPRFKYSSSVATDISKTFRRVRAEQRKGARL
ncbi:hypothetical protein QTI51_03950 [Variovorax sp. J22G73]|uniref:hypothetical protein n=1 Tax=unclassified Variovorax TaxID=663243 RepID=UPI00257513EC|nr:MULTISPECIES: hypothetical protein [unclassified Variovorax]MDM0003919.1 hypothetical protein [Variovorax sp. J22R203]MDM0096415.1 hypothetical protein [Variovorax sp. J22G73]